jgi:hypothetical protein
MKVNKKKDYKNKWGLHTYICVYVSLYELHLYDKWIWICFCIVVIVQIQLGF